MVFAVDLFCLQIEDLDASMLQSNGQFRFTITT